jgi:hypothetical protein
MDQRLRAGGTGTADPPDVETARELNRLVDSVAIWIRQFPSARALDDALRGWRVMALPRDDAAALLRDPAATRVVPKADADSVTELLEAGVRDGEAGAKASVRGTLSARNLLYRAGLLAAEELAARDAQSRPPRGAVALPTSLLGRRLRALLNAAEPEIARIVAALPGEVRQALVRLLAGAPMQGETIETTNEPPPDFSPEGVRALVLANRRVPDAWIPFVTTLDLSGSPIRQLRRCASLTALQSLDLRYTWVSDVAPLAGLTALQSLDLMVTEVSDVAPLAGLTALQSLDLEGTQKSDVVPLRHLNGLRILR